MVLPPHSRPLLSGTRLGRNAMTDGRLALADVALFVKRVLRRLPSPAAADR